MLKIPAMNKNIISIVSALIIGSSSGCATPENTSEATYMNAESALIYCMANGGRLPSVDELLSAINAGVIELTEDNWAVDFNTKEIFIFDVSSNMIRPPKNLNEKAAFRCVKTESENDSGVRIEEA